MSGGWQTKPIGEIFRVVNGGTPKTGVAAYWDGEHQWITPAEMGGLASPYLALSRRTLTDQGLRFGAELVPQNSIILSTRAPIGHLVINEVPMAFNQGCKGLVPPRGIDTKFAFYYLLANVPLLESLGTGATFKELSGGKLKQVPFRFPALPEQRRIVAILDEAFEAIAKATANTEKNVRNARELFEAKRGQILLGGGGWDTAHLSELCEIRHGYAFEGEFFASAGDYVLLTPGNFFEAGGYRDRGEKQKYFVGPIPREYVLSEGDLLVAMTEQAAGLLGSPVLVPESERFLHNQRLGLIVARPGAPWANEFFFHVFNLATVRAEIHASASGVKVRHTSPSKIGAVRVRFPRTVDKQLEVARSLDDSAAACEQLACVYRTKLFALNELKKSLLDAAFTGQLTTNSADKQVAEVA